MAVLALLTVVGCASRTRVDLESANAPAVQPVDGGVQNDADVVDADVTAINDAPNRSATTQAAATTVDPAAPTTTGQDDEVDDVDDATTALCRNDKRIMKTAVEDYRADQGTSPTSEGDLIAFAYVRTASELYDVRVDGSIVAQGATCLGVR